MIESLFCRSHAVARFRQGPLAPYMEELAADLLRQSYARHTVRNYLWSIASFGDWLAEQELGAGDVTLCRVEAPASFFQMAALMAPIRTSATGLAFAMTLISCAPVKTGKV